MEIVQSSQNNAINSGSRLFGCVAENNQKFLSQALRLLLSIRWFGGASDSADFMICVVDNCDPIYEEKFRQLNATIRIVEPFHEANPFSNKLRLLEQPELRDHEFVVLLDCDTLVVQDPTPDLTNGVIQAKIADLPTVPNQVLIKLCKHFNLPVPQPSYSTTFGSTPTIWYCNSGVVSSPVNLALGLGARWSDYVLKLVGDISLLGPYQRHCNQAALTLAFLSDPLLPFNEFPVEMNFPLHLANLEAPKSLQQADPVILHYHNQIDEDGFLLPCAYPLAQERVQLFNNRLRAFLRQ